MSVTPSASPIGVLFLIFSGITIFAVLGLAFLFLTKNKTVSDVMLGVMTVFSFVVAYISSTALPSNYFPQKILSWVIALVAVLGVYQRLHTKKQGIVSKIIVAVSVFIGVMYLFVN